MDEALENLIVLQAEERLAVVTNVGLGTGSIGKNESRKILNDLRRQSISRRTPADRTEDRGSVEDFQKADGSWDYGRLIDQNDEGDGFIIPKCI